MARKVHFVMVFSSAIVCWPNWLLPPSSGREKKVCLLLGALPLVINIHVQNFLIVG